MTLGGDITMNTVVNDGAVVVNFGSQTDGKQVNVDLGGAVRTISVGQGKTTLKVFNTITNGGLILDNVGTILLNDSTNDYGLGTILRGAGSVNVMPDTFGSGSILIENALLTTSGNCTFTKRNKIILDGTLHFSSGGNTLTLDGDIEIRKPVEIEASKGTLTLTGQVVSDSPYGFESVTKSGGGTLNTLADINVTGDVTLKSMQGNWTINGAVKTDGKLAIYGGGNYGDASVKLMSTENAFKGPVVIEGDQRTVSLCLGETGAHPEGVTFVIKDKGALTSSKAYSCAYYLDNKLIDPSSTGVLGVGVADSTEMVDMRGCPYLYFGASGGNLTFKGTLVPNEEAGYRLGGPNYLTLGGVNVLTGKHDVYIKNSSVFISASQDVEGTVYVPNEMKLTLQGASGALPNCLIVVGRYSTLDLVANQAGDVVRAHDIELQGGYITVKGNANGGSKQIITGALKATEVRGGYSIVRLYKQDATNVALECNTLEISTNAVLGVEGLNLGAAPGPKVCNFYAKVKPDLVGGNGAAGTTTISIVPRLIGGTIEATVDKNLQPVGSQSGHYAQSFVTYEDAVGFRPLDLETEYVQGAIPTEGTQHNVRLFGWETRELAASATINALLLQSKNVTSGLVDTLKLAEGAPEGTALTITSGQLISGQRRQNTTMISAPIDFGSAHGMVTYGAYNFTSFDSPFAGSGGMTLVQSVLKQNNVRYASFCGKSSFTGDVYALSDIGFENGFLPDDKARSGSFHLSYLANCSHPSMTINALNGDGAIAANNSGGATLTLGMDGADGDYVGRIGSADGSGNGSKYWIVKNGAGRQRLGGRCTQWQPVTVEAGVLQVDGEFTNTSKTTVKAAATLAGSGSFHDSVTLEDGAKLEAGSLKSDDDQVMNLNGGLTLKGAATLDLVATDRVTVGGVAVKGAFTIPTDKVVTVNVLLAKDAQGKDLKLKGPAQHVVFAAESPLTLANFKRGTNCGPLTLSQDGTQLLMTVQNGFTIAIR